MNKPTIRRVFAYIIDIIIISFISSLFINIEFLNPNYDEYEKVYNEYLEYSTESISNPEVLDDEKFNDLTYQLSKTGSVSNGITLVVTALYFIGFQFINHGQTIGKKLLKIKIISRNDKLKFSQVLIRSLLINSIVTNFLSIFFVNVLSKNIYLNINQYIQLFDMCIICISIIMIMFNNEGLGLHDKLVGTMVVLEEESDVKEANVVNEKTKSKTKTKKSSEE